MQKTRANAATIRCNPQAQPRVDTLPRPNSPERFNAGQPTTSRSSKPRAEEVQTKPAPERRSPVAKQTRDGRGPRSPEPARADSDRECIEAATRAHNRTQAGQPRAVSTGTQGLGGAQLGSYPGIRFTQRLPALDLLASPWLLCASANGHREVGPLVLCCLAGDPHAPVRRGF